MTNDFQYDAFISYRHAKRDAEVASAVQKGLEHFHVPKAIRKKTGHKKINRIFRDQEELSLTSDLSDEIREALAASRFLIMICSSHTRESVWVDREISFFLQTHDKDHILTVIVEGEPKDVLPERLLEEDREPLSADYRLSKRSVRNRELPRIAAALLGCGYDELVQRAQQYRMRRMAALTVTIVAVSLTAILYLSWSRTRIANSLREARISQAKYLSNEVDTLLNEDHDVTAAQLAQYTVPQDRSLTPPQSWQALADASYAYMVPQRLAERGNTKVVGELRSEEDISFLRDNHGGDKFCTVDETNHIHVWDAAKQKELLSFQNRETVRDMALAGEVLVVADERQLAGYRISDGDRIWTIDRGTSSDGSLAVNREETEVFAINVNNYAEYYLTSIDPESGKVSDDFILKKDDGSSLSASHLEVDKEGKYAAFADLPDSGLGVCVCDLGSGEIHPTEINMGHISRINFLENGSLIVCGQKEDDNSNVTGYLTGELVSTIGPVTADVYCVSASSGETLWKSDVRYGLDEGYSTAGLSRYKDSSGETHPAVLLTAANILQIYDADTGEKIKRIEFPAPIMCVVTSGEDLSDMLIRAVCRDGAFCLSRPGEDYMNCRYLFENSLKAASYYYASDDNWGYYVGRDNYVLQYKLYYSDPDFTEFSGSDQEGTFDYFCENDDNYIAVRSTSDLYTYIVEMYDKEEKKLQKSFSVGNLHSPDYLGVTEDGKKLVYYNQEYYNQGSDAEGVFALSLENGKSERISLPVNSDEDEEAFYRYTGRRMILQDDVIYYTSQKERLCSYNLDTDELHSFSVRSDNSATSDTSAAMVCALSISPQANYAFVSFDDGRMILLDLSGEKVQAEYSTDNPLYASAYSASGAVTWNIGAETFAVAGDSETCLCDFNGNIVKEIPYSGAQAMGVHFYQNGLLVVYTDGMLSRYSLPGGKLLNSMQTHVYNSSNVTDPVSGIFREDGSLCLFLNHYATVIDTNEWVTMYSVPNCFLYDSDKQEYIVYATPHSLNKFTLGCFPEYTLDDLIEKCREAGNNQDPDEDTLARYGLMQ